MLVVLLNVFERIELNFIFDITFTEPLHYSSNKNFKLMKTVI